MLEHESEGTEQELLDEQLSDDELKELLHRMGEFEFGGAIQSRVRDVVEATGKDPKAIGRLLADIRKESFEKKYGLKIQEHEVRIEHLEEKVDRPIVQTPQPDFLSEFDTEDIEELQTFAEQRRKARETSMVAVPIAIFICLCLFMSLLTATRSNKSPSPQYVRTWTERPEPVSTPEEMPLVSQEQMGMEGEIPASITASDSKIEPKERPVSRRRH